METLLQDENILASIKDDQNDQNDSTPQKGSSNSSTSLPRTKAVRSRRHSSQVKKDRDIIHKAAQKGKTELLKDLIKKKKNLVNARNESGHIPIHLAALHSRLEAVELLIESGSDLLTQDNSGWSVLHFAASGRNEKIISLLLEQTSVDGMPSF